jgi:hypothetical protein
MPFNLELQIVGPSSAETIQINDIMEYMPTVHLPIPKDVDRDGGSFEVDIGWSSQHTVDKARFSCPLHSKHRRFSWVQAFSISARPHCQRQKG